MVIASNFVGSKNTLDGLIYDDRDISFRSSCLWPVYLFLIYFMYSRVASRNGYWIRNRNLNLKLLLLSFEMELLLLFRTQQADDERRTHGA